MGFFSWVSGQQGPDGLVCARASWARAPWWVLCVGVLGACGGDDDGPPVSPDGGAEAGVHPRFELAADPMDFGAIPFPDDLYLEDGVVSVGELPGEDTGFPAYYEALREGFRSLDGFGAVSPIYFYVEGGGLDPASLPADATEATREDASVFLMDADPASSTAFTRMPIAIDWQADRDQLALRPEDGHPLREGRRYAAVVTSEVRTEGGDPLAPAPSFAAIRDADARPSDPLLSEAYDQYGPVLASLEGVGVPREEVVALAVFRVQTVTDGLEAARDVVQDTEAPVAAVAEVVPSGEALDAVLGTPAEDAPGLDVEGGVAHDAIGWMIQGTYGSPWLLSEEPHVHGPIERHPDGAARVRRTEQVPFTLLLPKAEDLSELRVVLFQHGLGSERSAVFGLANTLVDAGYAVVAIDAPWHGLRADREEPDTKSRFTGADVPDGFGDVTGGNIVVDFAGITDSAGPLANFHPFYLRDALRQSVVDLLQLAKVLRTPESWSAVRAADPALDSLGFAALPVGFVGNSLGGIIGTMFTAAEPTVGASVLSVTGGFIMRLVLESPPFNQGYVPVLWPMLGLRTSDIDYDAYHPIYYPEVAIWQTMLDRGDSINHAAELRGRPVSLFMPMALHDETMPNLATESLARAIDVPMASGTPSYTDLATVDTPVRGNVTVGEDTVTRVLYVHEPATHGLLLNQRGTSQYVPPVEAPFEAKDEEVVENPNEAALSQVLHFFESWRAGTAEVTEPL